MSAAFSWSIEIRSSSSPQTEACQPRSQLFAPSTKPSSETKFHMMSFLIAFPPGSGHKDSLFYLHPDGGRIPKRPEALLRDFRFTARARENVERRESECPRGNPKTPHSKGRRGRQGAEKYPRSLASPDREVRVYRLPQWDHLLQRRWHSRARVPVQIHIRNRRLGWPARGFDLTSRCGSRRQL